MAAAASVAPTVQFMPGSVNLPLAKFPTADSSKLDPHKTAEAVVDAINSGLAKADYDGLARHFLEDGYWRDHLAISWEFHTQHGPSKIANWLKSSAANPGGFRLKSIKLDDSTPVRDPKVVKIDANGKVDVVQFYFSIDTEIGTGDGIARVAADGTTWKIFTLYTIMKELKGFEEPLGPRRPQGVNHGAHPGRKNWAERREEHINYEDGSKPAVLIIGKTSLFTHIYQFSPLLSFFHTHTHSLLLSLTAGMNWLANFNRRRSSWIDYCVATQDAQRKCSGH